MIYVCKCCFYKTDRKSNYNKHLLSKSHILYELNYKKNHLDTEKNENEENNENSNYNIYRCLSCNKKFSNINALNSHISACYECKKIIDEKISANTSLKTSPHFSSQNPPKSSQKNRYEQNEMEINMYECEYCNKTFTRSDNLKRHQTLCKIKLIYDDNEKKEKEYIQKELERKNEEIKDLKEDVKFHKEMNISAGNLMHKQMNATILYLTKTYPNAPPLEAITGLDLQKHFIDQERIKEIEDYTFDEFHDFDEDEETKVKNEKRLETEKDKMRKIEVGKTITYIHYNKIFVPKMVKLICDIYKKNDPDKQSNWVSDVSRKSYYYKKKYKIKEETKKEKKNMQEQIEKDLTTSGWVFDPKGKEFESKTIEPLMSFIIEYAEMYHDSLIERMQKDKSINPIKTAIEIGNISELLRNVREKKYNKEIIGNITPLFHLQKN
jgi:hypothetical protein